MRRTIFETTSSRVSHSVLQSELARVCVFGVCLEERWPAVQVSPVGWCRCDGLTATLEAAAVVVVVMVMVVLTKVFALGARRHLYESYCSC